MDEQRKNYITGEAVCQRSNAKERRCKLLCDEGSGLSSAQLARSRAAIAADLEIGPAELIPFSAVTKTGAHEVRREIVSRL